MKMIFHFKLINGKYLLRFKLIDAEGIAKEDRRIAIII